MTNITDKETVEKVKKLNDHFRQTGEGGRLMITSGLTKLDGRLVSAIVDHVRNFESKHGFNKGNDPYGEHDFGSFEVSGVKVFWKIDYYDKDFKYHSEDKSDPKKTKRVLTIMKSEEW